MARNSPKYDTSVRPAKVLNAATVAVPVIGIGAVSVADRSPATPPGMRVRTGRFEKLRS